MRSYANAPVQGIPGTRKGKGRDWVKKILVSKRCLPER